MSAIVVALTALATMWAHWLDPQMNVGVMPATGVLLAALLVLEPRMWALPIVGAGAAILGVGLLYGRDFAAAGAPAVAALVGSLVGACALRTYARGTFTLRGVADVAALAVLGVGRRVHRRGSGRRGREARAHLSRLLDVAVAARDRGRARCARRRDGALVVGATSGSADAGTRHRRRDPRRRGARRRRARVPRVVGPARVRCRSLLLVWAAIRFRLRGVSTAALAMAAIADWSIARMTGPLVDLGHSPSATVLILQMFVAVSLLGLLFLAAALDERDLADAHRRIATDQFRRTFDTTPVGMALTHARRRDHRSQPRPLRDAARLSQGADRHAPRIAALRRRPQRRARAPAARVGHGAVRGRSSSATSRPTTRSCGSRSTSRRSAGRRQRRLPV